MNKEPRCKHLILKSMYKYLYNVYIADDLKSEGIKISRINYVHNRNQLVVGVPTRDVDLAEAIIIDTLDEQGVYAEVVDRVIDVNLTDIYLSVE